MKITDSVIVVATMQLHYAIQYEKEGWRVLLDTLAILHGRVRYYAIILNWFIEFKRKAHHLFVIMELLKESVVCGG